MSELFDYAPFLHKIDTLERQIHDKFLHKDFDVMADIDEIIVNARMLRAWVNHQREAA
jgi:hypothetical protein